MNEMPPPVPVVRTLDHIPDVRGRHYRQVSYSASIWGPIPDAYSLESHECQRLDQGQFGSCGGHGAAAGVFIRFSVLGKPLPWIPSPSFFYRGARSITRGAVSSGDLPTLTDSGVRPCDLAIAVATFGVEPMQETTTPDGRRSDVDDRTVDQELSIAEINTAGRIKVPGIVTLDLGDPGFTETLCSLISKGVPVGVGIWVDQAFQSYSGGVLDAVDMNDPHGGWHWVCAVAYRTDATGGRVIKLVNSWGDAWGDGTGHVELSAARMAGATSDAIAWCFS